MNIHEYQAKALLRKFGLPVPAGKAIFDAADAVAAATDVGGSAWAVKAQILAGSRGSGQFIEPGAGTDGGVRFADSLEAVKDCVEAMLGRTLVTSQTGAKGSKVNCVYIEERVRVAREHYLSMQIDCKRGGVTVIASTDGGRAISSAKQRASGETVTFSIDAATGLMPHHCRLVATTLGLTLPLADQAAALIAKIYEAFVATDMDMLEINPLAETVRGDLQCLDAKVSFDPNALFRQAEVRQMLEITSLGEDTKESEARKYGLEYIPLDGTIGCIANGAGLAMATFDVIKFYGEEPANFLDLGSGANEEKIKAAFGLILADADIQGVLVNIFSGIMKCDVIARGVIAAASAAGLTVPLVVRLEGINADLARDYMSAAGFDVIVADDLDDAAQKIVNAVRTCRANNSDPEHVRHSSLFDDWIADEVGRSS